MNTKEVLQAAYDLIGDKKRWTQGENARDKDGCEVSERSLSAVSWCAIGAVYHVGGDYGDYRCLSRQCVKRYERDAIDVNDEIGYAAIRRMLRKAIKEA